MGAFVWDADQARARTGLVAWLTRHQAALFFPMLTLEALNLRVSSVQAVVRPGLRFRKTEALLLLGHFALYLALLISTMTWLQGLVFLAVHQALFGVYLGSAFAPAHKGMPPLTPEQAADPLLRQVLTSRNVRGGPAVDFALGGLNLQIEHHLFPSMPRPEPATSPADHRAPLPGSRDHLPGATLLESYAIGLRYLHEVGAPLRDVSSD